MLVKSLFLAVSCVGACAVAPLAAAFDEISAAAYPDADTVVLDEIERVIYNADGTYVSTDECWTKVLTEKGRREASTATLDYSRRYGRAMIMSVGIIGTNGVERTVDVSATTKESTDNSSMASNIYDPLDRKIVCTVPGLAVGEILHVKTFRKTLKPRCEGKWADLSVMEWNCPIVRSTYEVTSPAALPLKKIAIRNPLGNVRTNLTTHADGSCTYSFTVADSPQAFPEPDMPPLYTQVQNVRVSTSASWPDISRWYWNLSAPHIAKTNAALVAKARELKDIRSIFKFVSQEVRYMGLTMEDTSPGYAPHDVDVTFDNRYGVCRDKAGLLVAMLRAAGHAAFPVLIHAGAKLDPEVPQPFFNHAIVAVDRGACDYELMDPTNENAKDLFPAYLSNCSYIVARPEGDVLRLSPVTPAEHNALTVRSDGTLGKDGALFLESDLAFNGINDTAYRHALVRRTPEERVKLFERIVKGLASGAELVSCRIDPKDMRDTDAALHVRLGIRLPEAVLKGTTRDELAVPFLTKTLGMANFLLSGSTSLETRRFPLVVDSTAQVHETVAIDLGGNLGEAADLPADVRLEGGYEYALRYALTNGVLKADRRLAVTSVEFSPEAYARMREDIKRVEANERKRVSFARDELAEADVRRLLLAAETTVFSDTEWVTTNVSVKEVLTYAGKKDSAEVKFGFHPGWKDVRVLTAVVSNRNGRVYAATAREMNVMDCSWASAAPRYPAGKMLVVNLPAVEIGSVIALTTVTTVTNAPVSFYADYLFDSHEPLERRIVRVNDWRREVVSPARLPREPNQPHAAFWRDIVVISSNDFSVAADRLSQAADVDAVTPDPELFGTDEIDAKVIRDWMAKQVKVVGPGLYELPLESQLTNPEVVLRERYATRLDYVRTLCALLKGAGYEADIVFAARNAHENEALRVRDREEFPCVRAFSAALCRVRLRVGGFLGFGTEEQVFFVGTENQYSPMGPSAYAGCDFFDPCAREFGLVTVPLATDDDCAIEKSEYVIRDNGSVDLSVENLIYGAGVGAFRKTYSEMLPEERSRRYQAILGDVAQAASATSELDTEVEDYPARRAFSCYIPDYVTISGDMMTIQLPALLNALPAGVGSARRTPFAVASASHEIEEVTVRFPEGYTEVEHVPEPFAFADPLNATNVWMTSVTKTCVEDGGVVVTLRREVLPRAAGWYRPPFYELVKDWCRIARARANRTIVVRRKGKGR